MRLPRYFSSTNTKLTNGVSQHGDVVRWLKYSLAFYPKWFKSILAFTTAGAGSEDTANTVGKTITNITEWILAGDAEKTSDQFGAGGFCTGHKNRPIPGGPKRKNLFKCENDVNQRRAPWRLA